MLLLVVLLLLLMMIVICVKEHMWLLNTQNHEAAIKPLKTFP